MANDNFDLPRPTDAVPSASSKVINDNAKVLDYYINETGGVITRKGVVLKTIPDQESLASGVIDTIEQEALSRSRQSDPVVLTAQQSSVTVSGFNASLSAYYISAPLGDDVPAYRLFAGKHYTFADITTETIDLVISPEAGYEIFAVSLDPTGSGVVANPLQFQTMEDLELANAITAGSVVEVVEYGLAKFEIYPAGTATQPGDRTLVNGQVAVLVSAPDGSYDVQWFGAPDDPDDVLGDQTAFFEMAAQRAGSGPSGGMINVFGSHRVNGTTASVTTWRLGPRTKILGRPGVDPSSDYDLSGLSGQVISINSADAYGTMYIGDPTFYVQKVTNKTDTDAAVTGAGVKGSPGATFTSFTSGSDFNPSRQSSIGATFRVVVDSTLGITGWGKYVEHYKMPGAVGNCFGTETTCFNAGSIVVSNPYAQPGLTTGVTIGHWFSAGGVFGSAGSVFGEYTQTNDATAAMGMIGKAGALYDKGLIVYDNSITSKEVVAMPSSYQFSWWGGVSGSRQKVAYVSAANPSGNNGQMQLNVFDDSTSQFDYLYYAPGQFSPIENNKVTLANAGAVYQGAFFQNAPTIVSDIRKKDEIRDLTENELSAGLALARNMKIFKWIDEINQNQGLDKKTYDHISVMAQTAWNILEDNNLDPTDYGMISNDPKGWSITPSEMSFLMCAALVKNQDLLDQRIAALESI